MGRERDGGRGAEVCGDVVPGMVEQFLGAGQTITLSFNVKVTDNSGALNNSDTETVTRDGVARAWRSTLQQVQEWEFGTVSVPPIGTGAGNLTVEDAAEIMVTILKVHLGGAAFPADVSFVVETPAERDAFEAVLHRSGADQS